MPKQDSNDIDWVSILRSRKSTYVKHAITYSSIEFDVITYIGAFPLTTLEEIINAPLFASVTRSTVKRVVLALKAGGVVEWVAHTSDKRKKLLKLTGKL
jgi:DNA-binding MarR family transcriptional regulator